MLYHVHDTSGMGLHVGIIQKLANHLLLLFWCRKLIRWGQHLKPTCDSRLHSAFLYFSVLVVITSWSYQVSEFHWVKSDNGKVMCGTSPPNKTLKAVISRLHCVSSCNHGCPSLPCQAINYWKNAQLCQQFVFVCRTRGLRKLPGENNQALELWNGWAKENVSEKLCS